jgi:hypothetical protein
MQEDDEGGEDNPIVALEPEDEEGRGRKEKHVSIRTSDRERQEEMSPQIQDSLYRQEKDFLGRKEREKELASEEYHVTKTKEFNVYGKLR